MGRSYFKRVGSLEIYAESYQRGAGESLFSIASGASSVSDDLHVWLPGWRLVLSKVKTDR